MKTYGGIPVEFAEYEKAKVLLQSIPFDGTSTWGKGADKGFQAFLEATENMELYDIETDSEVYKQGIFIQTALEGYKSPEEMYKAVYQSTKENLKTGKYLTAFGGEHSISIGIMQAFYEKYDNLSIVQLDAHADLRKSYLGSEYNHACALHQASKNANLIQIGVRSMDICEKQYINYDKCFFAHQIQDSNDWMQKSIDLLTNDVYLTIDLDALDPSIIPGTGTPEPGGLAWYQTLKYLRMLMEQRNVVGFDIVELAPKEGLPASEFLVAKLYYKLLSYKFHLKKK